MENSGNRQKPGGIKGRSPLQVSQGAWPCQHLDFGFLAPEAQDHNFCGSKPPSVWYVVRVALGAPHGPLTPLTLLSYLLGSSKIYQPLDEHPGD